MSLQLASEGVKVYPLGDERINFRNLNVGDYFVYPVGRVNLIQDKEFLGKDMGFLDLLWLEGTQEGEFVFRYGKSRCSMDGSKINLYTEENTGGIRKGEVNTIPEEFKLIKLGLTSLLNL